MSSELVFAELYLPRPFDPATVARLVARLASDTDAPRMTFEVRAEAGTIRYLLGCRSTDIPRTRHLLTNLLPGALMNGLSQPRRPVAASRRMALRPRGLPLNTASRDAFILTVLTALAACTGAEEVLVLQFLIGPRIAPRRIPSQAHSVSEPWWQPLLGQSKTATAEERSHRRQHAEQHGMQALVRIGINAPDSGRRRRLASGLMSALRLLQSPGQGMDFVFERAVKVFEAALPMSWPLTVSAEEAACLLAWPSGGEELPGLPPIHPRQLRAAPAMHSGDRVFARSTIPGDKRRLGVSSADALMHLVAYGPTGSGKSTTFEHLIAADIAAGLPVVVVDPKKQLAINAVTSHIPPERLNDVVVLDAAAPHPVGFNPLAVTGGRDPDVIADGILSVFKSVFHDGWGPRTEDIYSACIRTLTRTSTQADPATLIDLPRLLTDAVFRRPRTAKLAADPGLAGFWAWYENLSPAGQAAAVAAPFNKLRQLLLRPALVAMLGRANPSVNLRDVFREKKIILVPLNEGLIGEGTASLLGSLVIAELWQATQERAGETNPMNTPGMIYIDEAHRFLHLPVSLADALNQSRSLGVGWHLATQFPGQFPTEIRDAVATNARSKIVFAQEPDDAKYFARKAKELIEEDFVELPKYHAYVNLVDGGSQSGWASVAMLPPRTPVSDPATVLAASTRNYQQPALAAPTHSSDESPTDAAPIELATPTPVGRKRRRT